MNSLHSIEAELILESEIGSETSSKIKQDTNSNQQLHLLIPPRSKQVKVLLNDQEQSCLITEKEGFSDLACAFQEVLQGSYVLKVSYQTTYPLFDLKDKLMYKTSYKPLYNTKKFSYVLELPIGYIIPQDKGSDFFVNPSPESLNSNGQNIILVWERKNVNNPFEVSVIMQKADTNSVSSFLTSNNFLLRLLFILVSLLVIGNIAYVAFKKWKKDHNPKPENKHETLQHASSLSFGGVNYPALIQQEEIIVKILKNNPEHIMWQKQLQIQSGYNKVKLSRILRSLESRGVIKKEPWGNTNKISLTEK